MPEATRDLVAELEVQLRSHLISSMQDPSGELAVMRMVDLLGRWFNWRDRLVVPRARSVHESSELLASQEAQDNAQYLTQIKSEISAGYDLTQRLSTRVSSAYIPSAEQGPLHHRRDLDLLLSDWGIHHLHLVHAPQRTDLLLFVVFRPDNAYLLQLLPHGSWTDQSLVEIIIRNWPDAGLLMSQLNGAVGLSQTYTEEERQQLRQAGVSVILEIDGGVYLPRGMSMAGMAISSTMRGDQIMRALQAQREQLSSDPTALDVFIRSKGYPLAGVGVWEPYIGDGKFGFLEPTAMYRIPVGFL
jgi:hypothetical protein